MLTFFSAYAIFNIMSDFSCHTPRVVEETPFSTVEEGMKSRISDNSQVDRRSFIGGSDARVIMGDNETALLQLWREKRGAAP
jgi:hypothetical protein